MSYYVVLLCDVVVRCCCCYVSNISRDFHMSMTDVSQLSAQICEMTLQQHGLAMSINEINASVKVTSVNLTPSNDCQSSAEGSYTQLMESLQLCRTMSLLGMSMWKNTNQ